ncbi:hypothetical protein LTR53_011748, partial [Teratosphaeriaceae sp. CCFEE 6253]
LLEASYKDPPALHTVREAVIMLKQIRLLHCFSTFNEHSNPYEERERLRDVSRSHPLYETLRALDFEGGDATRKSFEDEVVKHLTWHEPALHMTRQAHLAADSERWHVQPYMNKQGDHFTHYAAPLLLMLCPNIETLTYSACPLDYDPDPAHGHERGHLLERTLLRNNYALLPEAHLQQLRHLRLLPETGLWWDDGRDYSHVDLLGQIRLFHRLPAIESIAVDGITIHGGADYINYLPPHTSNIRRIAVGHSLLPGSIVAALIRMPRHLEAFSLAVGGRDSNDGGYYAISPKTLGKTLWDQRDALRKIDLDIDDVLTASSDDEDDREEYMASLDEDTGESYWRDTWFKLDEQVSTGPLYHWDLPDTRQYDETIGSLHDFQHLTHLSIGIKLLLGPPDSDAPFQLIEGLPTSLEYLLLRGYTRGQVPRYDEAIDELLARRSKQLPALTQLQGVDALIPSAEFEQTSRRWPPPAYNEEEEEAHYWKLDESNRDWLEA